MCDIFATVDQLNNFEIDVDIRVEADTVINMHKLTEVEIKSLQGICDSEFHDGCDRVGNWVWSWSCNPFDSKKVFSGAVSSLVKKGYVKSCGHGEDACLCITQDGMNALKQK